MTRMNISAKAKLGARDQSQDLNAEAKLAMARAQARETKKLFADLSERMQKTLNAHAALTDFCQMLHEKIELISEHTMDTKRIVHELLTTVNANASLPRGSGQLASKTHKVLHEGRHPIDPRRPPRNPNAT